jgi:hypothetical protein
MARHAVVALGVLVGSLLPPVAAAEGGRKVAGVVLDADGKPAAGVEVVLEVGRTRLALTEEFDRWEAVRTDRATSGEDGRFAFSDVPPGASLVAWAKSPAGFASAPVAESVTLTLAPLGSVRGKLTGKSSHLKGVRVFVSGPFGRSAEGKVDEAWDSFDVPGAVPGEGRLHVYRSNFEVARVPVQVTSGEETRVKAVRVTGDFLPVADPLVDDLEVRLVNADGRPVAGVQLVWSSQWMDGGMNSDEEGIVRLAGGGVAIGGPPYRLRLGNLRQGASGFRGVLKADKGGRATVEVHPLVDVSGTVSLGGKPVDLYRLYAVTDDGKTPRVVTAGVEKGRYALALPDGPCRVVVVTVDGKRHETTIPVAPAESPQTHELKLD